MLFFVQPFYSEVRLVVKDFGKVLGAKQVQGRRFMKSSRPAKTLEGLQGKMPRRLKRVVSAKTSLKAALLISTFLVTLTLVPYDVRAQTAPTPSLDQGKTNGVPAQVVGAFDTLFGGSHAEMRAVHAKGVLCEGVFAPDPGARTLTRAEHLQGEEVPVLVRFSNFSGAPTTADNDPTANPRGMAIKFLLPGGNETDIVAHSYNGFPAATPEEFLHFLTALAVPANLEAFLAQHPAALAFMETPKPTPASYGSESFFGVSAFRFTNAAGVVRHGRYRLVPVAGGEYLAETDAAGRAPNFLRRELAERLALSPVLFRLSVQLADESDPITNGSLVWPSDRPMVELGTLRLHALVPDGDAAQRELLFTPLNLVGGIAATADPMLVARTQAYRISHERRRVPQ